MEKAVLAGDRDAEPAAKLLMYISETLTWGKSPSTAAQIKERETKLEQLYQEWTRSQVMKDDELEI